jgi:hypothetical protein
MDDRSNSGQPAVKNNCGFTAEDLKQYPNLCEMPQRRDLPLQAQHTTADTARIFECDIRVIQERIHSGKWPARDLPKRGRFFPCDLEQIVQMPLLPKTGNLNISTLASAMLGFGLNLGKLRKKDGGKFERNSIRSYINYAQTLLRLAVELGWSQAPSKVEIEWKAMFGGVEGCGGRTDD